MAVQWAEPRTWAKWISTKKKNNQKEYKQFLYWSSAVTWMYVLVSESAEMSICGKRNGRTAFSVALKDTLIDQQRLSHTDEAIRAGSKLLALLGNSSALVLFLSTLSWESSLHPSVVNKVICAAFFLSNQFLPSPSSTTPSMSNSFKSLVCSHFFLFTTMCMPSQTFQRPVNRRITRYFSKLSKQWVFQFYNIAQRSFPNSVKCCPSSTGPTWGNTQHMAELSQQQSSASVVAPGFPPFQKKQSMFTLCLAPAALPSLPPGCLGARGMPNQNSSAPLPSPPDPHPSVWEQGGPGLTCGTSSHGKRGKGKVLLPNSPTMGTVSCPQRLGRSRPMTVTTFVASVTFSLILYITVKNPCVWHISTRAVMCWQIGALNPVTGQKNAGWSWKDIHLPGWCFAPLLILSRF